MHASSRSFLRFLLAAFLMLPLLALVPALPATAATAGPTGLAPNGMTVTGTPVFSWDAMPGATVYDVQVLDSDGTTVLTSVANTVNTHWVPTTYEIPTGRNLTWQVRGLVSGVESDWSSAPFMRAAVDAPQLTSPAADQELRPPADPLIYRWLPVPGAKSYTVEVSPDQNFVDSTLIKTYNTTATMVAPNLVPADGTYYWRVTANLNSGVKSNRSEVRLYTVNAVVRTSDGAPLEPISPGMDQVVDDVVLAWHPIDGAATYTLQISNDSNFLNNVTTVTGIKSTRYSPTTTLKNDQYWWRVAPVNAENYQTPWNDTTTPTWRFRRAWVDQPHLQYPAAGAAVGDPFYFQWTPVHLASKYTLEMSQDSSFSTGVTSCSTVHTTYTPSRSGGDCWPGAAGTYYWRVKAFDDPAGVVSEYVLGEENSFTYSPDLVTLSSPADGATVSIPTLRWQPFPNADHYNVSLTPVGGSTTTKTTISASMTWPSKLMAGTTYRWQVQPVFDDGRVGTGLLLGSQRTFVAQDPDPAVATSPEPISAEAAAVRPPLLTWTPVDGATSYTVQVHPLGAAWPSNPNLAGTFAYPSGSDTTGLFMNPGTYEWKVVVNGGPYDGVASSTTGTYTILPFASVGGYRAAISGTDSGDLAKSCTAQLPADCQNLRQTPLLRWDPVEGAASYKLVISRDQNLTNVVKTVTVKGANLWIDTVALPDADAGTAYFWDVVPCGPSGICAPSVPAQHQFNKTGIPVHLTSPLGGTAPNDIRFSWEDYLTTLQTRPDGGSSLTTAATTEARQYRIQVSQTADFSSIIDDKTVDQTTYTPYDKTYPEQPLYWRVQAIDGSGNPLPWSPYATVSKVSPVPVLAEGSGGESFSGSISLGWQPLAFAKTYEVRVYHAGVDPDIATAVLTQTGLKQSSFTPTDPLTPGDYIWRVRRADADGRTGDWSAVGHFTSAGSAPSLLSPADDAEVPPRTAVFTWQPATDAPVSSYRFQMTKGTTTTTVNTGATSYAPTARIADGTWTWTVAALDTKNNVIGTSAPRSFTVNGTLTPTGPITLQGSGSVGSLLTILPFTWNQPDTTTTYQWYRGTSVISGATGSTYTVTASDVGKTIKVRVFGQKVGYDTGAGTDSNAIGVNGTTTGGTTTSPSTVASRTYVTLAKKKIRKRKRGLVYVQVSSSVAPSGTVRVYDRSRVLVTITIGSGSRVAVRLPRLKKGKHPIWAKYLGSSRVLGSSSGRVTLRVVR
ncbi:MAG TPA: hypothetical protein VHO29_17750 [Marmoricola sp.]|nr:hypothetical protein [Marmoricola sp.]